MTPCPGYAIVHNDKITRLASGRIIAAAERKKRWPDSNDHGGYVACTFYSDDNAYSWQMSQNEVDMDPMEAQEAHVEELGDGRLLMVFRTYSGFVGRAFSTDRGASWSAGELVQGLPISANACAVTLKRIPSTGDLLLIRTTAGDGGRRTPLVSVVSRDEGETWESPRELASDPEDDYGYQSVTFLPDEDVCVMSYHARDGLHVARIATGWFYGR
jgi:sialidase-1